MDGNPKKESLLMPETGGNTMLLSAASDKAVAGFRTYRLWPYGAESLTDDDVGYAISDEVMHLAVDRPISVNLVAGRHWITENVSADYWIITALSPVYGSRSSLNLAAGLSTTLPLIAGSTASLPPNVECHRQHCRQPPCHRHFRQPNDCP